MTLIHEDDMHFNLVVSKDSNLATMGSLSHRFNVGPIAKKTKVVENETTRSVPDLEDEDHKNDKNIDVLQRKLKESEESKRVILNEYLNCEKELRIKVEETGKLKTKIKDLQQIIRLSEKLKEKDLETSDDDELVTETKEEGNHIPWTKSKTKKDKRPR